MQHDRGGRRRELGARLRELRRGSGETATELAAKLGVNQSTISRYETGAATPPESNVAAWARVTGAGAEVAAELVELARNLANDFDPWRVVLQGSFEQHQREIGTWEAETAVIRTYQPTVIPGLLQVAEYSRQMLQRMGSLQPASLPEAVAARLQRQTVLYDEAKQFEFVITEAALRARVCESSVLRVQWDHLISLMTLANVDIRFLPSDAELPMLALNSFVMLDHSRVVLETQTAQAVVHDERDVNLYGETFAALHSVALSGDTAREFVQSLSGGAVPVGGGIWN